MTYFDEKQLTELVDKHSPIDKNEGAWCNECKVFSPDACTIYKLCADLQKFRGMLVMMNKTVKSIRSKSWHKGYDAGLAVADSEWP